VGGGGGGVGPLDYTEKKHGYLPGGQYDLHVGSQKLPKTIRVIALEGRGQTSRARSSQDEKKGQKRGQKCSP